MQRLGLDTFLSGPQDAELRQFRILQGLKELKEHFAHNRLYPHLAGLIGLSEELEEILEKGEKMQRRFPRRLKGLDLEHGEVEYEPAGNENAEIDQAMSLIAWALPFIRKVIEEGIEIYNFVDGHIAIEEVGIQPAYRMEGYWFVPDLKATLLHVLRYEVSLFTSSKETYRSLKSVFLESIAEGLVRRPPESVKRDLWTRYPDMPSSATYRCEVDLEFPYLETVLPIAKRKLIARLVS